MRLKISTREFWTPETHILVANWPTHEDLERNARVLISEFHEIRVCVITAINSGVIGGLKLEL